MPCQFNGKRMTLDEIDLLILGGKERADELNTPKSEEFVTNARGQRLHVCTHWPEGEVKAFVVFIHGYASHGNRPTHNYVRERFVQQGVAYITLDLHSHGYSEGDVRCMAHSKDDLIDDLLALLLALAGDGSSSPTHHLRRTAQGVPFFLLGHSMGGAITIATACILHKGAKAVTATAFAQQHMPALTQHLQPAFKGCLLIAPLTWVSQVPDWVFSLLYPLSYAFPTWATPTFLRPDTHRWNWASERFITYVQSDSNPEHNGILYWGGIRVGMAVALYELCVAVQAAKEQAEYPFLILHDPEDQTVGIVGSRDFMQTAPSRHKRMIEMQDARHDPLANQIDVTVHYLSDWVQHHLKVQAQA